MVNESTDKRSAQVMSDAKNGKNGMDTSRGFRANVGKHCGQLGSMHLLGPP